MNVEERLEEQEKENIELKAKLEVLQTANIQHIEKESQLEKNIAALEENYQKEIAELKGKMSAQNEVYEEKLKKLEEVIHANQQKISEAEDAVMVTIHEMKVLLPLENWHDLLAFVPRSQLGNVVSEIGDYQFTRIIQSFLHDEVREITLGKMRIIAPRPKVPSDQPMLHVWQNTTNMPDSSMPQNIKDFKEIALNYVDPSVLNFLGKFQENSLLTKVNIHFHRNLRRLYENMDILPRVLTEIAPFITSIDSIESRSPEIDLIEMVYTNNTNDDISHELQLLLKDMMDKTRILGTKCYKGSESSWEDKMEWFCSWLYTPRNDGKPRMLRCYNNSDFCPPFIERIKKDFEMADHPVSLFISAEIYRNDNVEEISIDNVKTNEKFVIKIVNRGDVYSEKLMISRYPLNAAKTWIEVNQKEIAEWNTEEIGRKITLHNGLTINIVHSNQISET